MWLRNSLPIVFSFNYMSVYGWATDIRREGEDGTIITADLQINEGVGIGGFCLDDYDYSIFATGLVRMGPIVNLAIVQSVSLLPKQFVPRVLKDDSLGSFDSNQYSLFDTP